MDVKNFIAHYIRVVLDGDLKKMLSIAKKSQDEEEDEGETGQGPPVQGYTMSPNDPSFFDSFNPERARCAVPVTMTLFSVIDIMGTLLKASVSVQDNTRESIQNFFAYAFSKGITNRELTPQESGVLNAVYRNGCMHSFFPSGMNISLDLKDTELRPLKVDETKHRLTLNVNYLQGVVIPTVNVLMRDVSKHRAMQAILDDWMTRTYDSGSGRVKDRLDEFWNDRPY